MSEAWKASDLSALRPSSGGWWVWDLPLGLGWESLFFLLYQEVESPDWGGGFEMFAMEFSPSLLYISP